MKDMFEEHFRNISDINAKLEDAMEHGSGSKTKDNVSKDTTSHPTSDGSNHSQLSYYLEYEGEMDRSPINLFMSEEAIREQLPEQERTANNHIAEIRRFLHSYENSKEIIENSLDEYTTCENLHMICKEAETQITEINNLLKSYAPNYNSIVEGWTCLKSSILTLQGAVEKLPGFWEKVGKSVNITESSPFTYQKSESSSSQGRS